MKWDYSSVIVWGLDERGIPGEKETTGDYRFNRAVVELSQRLGGEIEVISPLNGYLCGFSIKRDDEIICRCFTSGSGSAAGSSQFDCASTASEVYPILQELHPQHSVSRLDAAEDLVGEGSWDKLEAMLSKVCTEYRVSMAPYGEGHKRPDGSRDATKGRTWYCGSKASAFRIVLYEKGLEQLAKGVPADPTWVRLEVRIRPSSKKKQEVGMMKLQPDDILGFSGWGHAVGQQLGKQGLERIAIGSVWKPKEVEQLALKIVRMFDNGIERILEYVSPEELGQIIAKAHQENRQATETLKEHAA